MSSYNLKDYINEWVNIEIAIDNTNNVADLFINGSSKDRFNFVKQITNNTNSKMYIGGNADKSKGFNGKMEAVTITNKAITQSVSNAKYNASRNSKSKMFDLKFKNNLTDSSRFKVSKRNANSLVSSSTDVSLQTDSNRYAVKFNNGKFIEMEPSPSMNGDKLENTTFSAWIKTPSASTNNGYEPILSRNGVFSFGLNNGHASLLLGKDNQIVPGTNITVPEQGTDIITVSDYNKIADISFDEDHSKVDVYRSGVKSTIATSGMTTVQTGILATKSIKVSTATDDKIELAKSLIVGKHLNQFSISMWVNFDTLTDNMILMERPEIGLKLSGDSTGKLSLLYNEPISLTFSDEWTSGTTYFDEGGYQTDTTNPYTFPTPTLVNGVVKTLTYDNSVVNVNVPGAYTIIYAAEDTIGRQISVSRTYVVIDTIPPIITFSDEWVLGDSDVSIKPDDPYTLPTVTVTDESGETIIPTITGPEPIDTSTVGEYVKTYTATDSAGNTKTITRTYVVKPPPSIIAFHYGNFDLTDYTSAYANNIDAAFDGFIYANTEPKSYTWGTLEVVSHTTTSTTYTWTPASDMTADVLIVAGGGSGGSYYQGGGGAGGLIYKPNESILSTSSKTITVGNSGENSGSYMVRGTNGQNSSFTSYIAIGGGVGGENSGSTGGSGGGGGWPFVPASGGSGTSGQGYSGGSGFNSYPNGDGGGGGGGAGGAGTNWANQNGGDGGIGRNMSEYFTTVYGDDGWFSSGGGGYSRTGTGRQGLSSIGGGGGLVNGILISAKRHTGGGGRAADQSSPGGSGSGIVIIKNVAPVVTQSANLALRATFEDSTVYINSDTSVSGSMSVADNTFTINTTDKIQGVSSGYKLGTSQAFTVSNLMSDPYTISFWMLSKYTGTWDVHWYTPGNWITIVTPSSYWGDNTWRMYLHANNGEIGIYDTINGWKGTGLYYTDIYNKWVLISINSNGVMTIKGDGVNYDSTLTRSGFTTSGDSIEFGGTSDNSLETENLYYDDIRIYNTALNSTDMLNIYNEIVVASTGFRYLAFYGGDFGTNTSNGQTFQELEIALTTPLGGFNNIKFGEMLPVSTPVETNAWTYNGSESDYGTLFNGVKTWTEPVVDSKRIQYKDSTASGSVLFYFDMGDGNYAYVSGGDYWTYDIAEYAIGSGKLYGTNTDPATLSEADRIDPSKYTEICDLTKNTSA